MVVRPPIVLQATASLVALVLVSKCAAAREAMRRPTPSPRSAPRWRVTETLNFRIYSFGAQPLSPLVAAQCEQLRSDVARRWIDARGLGAWRPKCTLVLHSTRASYQAAAGQMSDCTVACCTINAVGSETTVRRIDVCADDARWLEYLPHELTHVLLDGRLTAGELPRWADEGMALAADPLDKRTRHAADLQAALRGGRQFRLAELLTLSTYPGTERLGVFYGQGLSLVEFLVQRGGSQKLAEFLGRTARGGYDDALKQVYNIENVAAFESLWLASNASRESPTTSDLAHGYHQPPIRLPSATRTSASVIGGRLDE
jgi:hypothetical protein